MAHSERTRYTRSAKCASLRKCTFAIGMCLVLLAPQPASTQTTASQIRQSGVDTVYKLNYLADMAALAQDPALQQWLRQQIAEELRELQSLEWQAYRVCENMKHPTNGNDGKNYKWDEEEKHRNEAMKNFAGILDIFGGVPSAANAMVSAPGNEALDASKGNAIDIAKGLAEGTQLSGLFNKLGPALAGLDGGTQLYNTWKAVQIGIAAIDQRAAADAALTDCHKPPEPEHRELTQGTPYLRPFPPGPPPPPQPKNPPSPPPQQPDPKQPTPQKPIPLKQFLQQVLSAGGHGG